MNLHIIFFPVYIFKTAGKADNTFLHTALLWIFDQYKIFSTLSTFRRKLSGGCALVDLKVYSLYAIWAIQKLVSPFTTHFTYLHLLHKFIRLKKYKLLSCSMHAKVQVLSAKFMTSSFRNLKISTLILTYS